MALYQVFLQSLNIPYRQFGALNNISFEYKKEDGQVFYRKKLVKDLVFGQKDDYEEIFALTPFENEEVTVTIKVDCDGVFVEKWKGTFTIMDCKVDVDNCEIQVKPKVLDKYSCILSKMEQVINLYNPELPVITVKTVNQTLMDNGVFVQLGYVDHVLPTNTYYSDDPLYQGTDPIWWVEKEQTVLGNPPYGATWTVRCWYHHMVGYGTDTIPPDTTGVWYRWKNTIAQTDSFEPPLPPFPATIPPSPPGYLWHWVKRPNIHTKGLSDLDNGRGFIESLKYGLSQLDCINDISSLFYNYNPTIDPIGNLPYLYATKYMKYVTIHQKSDVKRPYDNKKSEPKTWTCKVKEILHDLKTMQNVYWDIDDDNNLVLEHISAFKSTSFINIKANCKNEYSYNNVSDLQSETYKYMDEDASDYFKGFDIKYLTNNGEVKENKIGLISTDIEYILDSNNAENVQDKGFVLCSNWQDGNTRDLKKFNTAFSFPILHEYLHRHERPYQEFYMNGVIDSALSKIKTKQQDEFFLFICCDSIKDTSGVSHEFDPKKLYTTSLGDGEIESAIHDLTKDTLTLKLNY